MGGRGGVYIVGGVIPRFLSLFLTSGFAECFADKGCMSDYFKGVPVWMDRARKTFQSSRACPGASTAFFAICTRPSVFI